MILSIIIPMFNSEKTIKRAINSCLINDLNNMEIILVDDGSTDSTISIVEKSFKKEIDSEVIKIINSHHSGAGAARNKGIQLANGNWIIFLDSDDEFIKFNHIKEDLIKIDKSVTILNYTLNPIKSDQHIVCGEKYISDNLGLNNDNKKNWDSGPVFKCYRRNFLNKNNIKFPLDIKIGEDLVFNLRCLLLNPKILTENRSMYRIHEEKNSLTHKIIPNFIVSDAIKLVREILRFDIDNKLKNEFIAKNYIAVLVRFLKSKTNITTIIYSLMRYKKNFHLKDSLMSFLKLHNSLTFYKVLIGWIIWINPSILKIILYGRKN